MLLALALGGPPASAADGPLRLVLTPSQKPTDLIAAGEEFGQALGHLPCGHPSSTEGFEQSGAMHFLSAQREGLHRGRTFSRSSYPPDIFM